MLQMVASQPSCNELIERKNGKPLAFGPLLAATAFKAALRCAGFGGNTDFGATIERISFKGKPTEMVKLTVSKGFARKHASRVLQREETIPFIVLMSMIQQTFEERIKVVPFTPGDWISFFRELNHSPKGRSSNINQAAKVEPQSDILRRQKLRGGR